MPRATRPIAPYMRMEPVSANRGQKRGVVRLDARTVHGRLVKNTRLALLEHIGPNATLPQQALIERIAFLELRAAIFDKKQIEGSFTPNDAAVHLAIINSLRRLYQTLGIQRPSPKFSQLMTNGKAA